MPAVNVMPSNSHNNVGTNIWLKELICTYSAQMDIHELEGKQRASDSAYKK